ncbi:SDR family oxidoreductase [Micromonospora sp. NPDC049559]|uniref:SDR family NAD(P)-dependent oxidoreductase n=1 Tax=Micromonospora sp. NPDC049559 TaxID=3155923 RepID=UPI0034340A17
MTTPPAEAAPAVIITGGGTGIGRATAHAFAERGARVLIVGRTEATLRETAEGHDGISTVVADITAADGPDLVVEAALRALGGIDVLVNNAATAAFGALGQLDRDLARTQFDTNLCAPIFLTQRALEPLAARGGTVVNVGTAGALGLRSWPNNAVYGASKAALDFLTRSWAVELAPRGIRVVGVAPGVVDTGVGVRAGMPEDAYQGFLKQMADRVPLGRVGRPEEIAWWIVQLTRPEARYANGMVVPIDGALSIT